MLKTGTNAWIILVLLFIISFILRKDRIMHVKIESLHILQLCNKFRQRNKHLLFLENDPQLLTSLYPSTTFPEMSPAMSLQPAGQNLLEKENK